jgi:diguanylate cyclase (GGDEF)-like protein
MSRTGSGAIWAFTLGLAAVAGALHWTVVVPLGDRTGVADGLVWPAVLVLGFWACERFAFYMRFGAEAYAFTLSEVPLILGLYFLPADQVLLVRLLGSVLAFAWVRKDIQKAAFNLAMFSVETSAAILVWHWILGSRNPLGPWGWLAVAAVIAITGLLSSLLVSCVITLANGRRPRNLQEIFSLGQLGDLINGAFALNAIYVLVVDWRGFWLLASVIAVLVVAYRSYDRARQRSERLQQINRFTELVGREVETDEVIRTVLDQIRSTFDVRLVELSRGEGAALSADWVHDGEARPGPASVLARLAVPDGASVVVPRGTRDAELNRLAATAGVRDAMVVPLRSEGRVLGSLGVVDRLGDVSTFTAADLGQLQALANHAAVALDNTVRAGQLIEQAREQAVLALRDELTGLANRRLLGRWLDDCLATQSAGLLLLDLDRFREVNDTLGHEIGDVLLRKMGERLAAMLPDGALLSRVGGDEFAVVLPGADERAATGCARQVLETSAESFELEGLVIAVEASIGVAVAPAGTARTSLLRWADMAMYSAKDSRAGFEVYRPELDRTDSTHVGLLADLRHALAGDGITVAYQPKVAVAGGRVVGAEALVRWNHPTLGPLPPDAFVSLAEHSSLIRPLTLLVLVRALRECARWRSLFGDFSVAVNISARSLLDPEFVAGVGRALAQESVPAQALTLEITETSLMSDPTRSIRALESLRELGVRLSVDDLGTGYSSLAYLAALPVDEIKIDRSFVRELADPRSAAVVSAMVDLGRRLGHTVVAEGIEDRAAYEALARLGCDVAQGYWLARPMPAAQLSRLVDGWEPLVVSGLRAIS